MVKIEKNRPANLLAQITSLPRAAFSFKPITQQKSTVEKKIYALYEVRYYYYYFTSDFLV